MVDFLDDLVLTGDKLKIVSVIGFDLQDGDLIIVILDQHDITFPLVFYCIQYFILLFFSVLVHQNNDILSLDLNSDWLYFITIFSIWNTCCAFLM